LILAKFGGLDSRAAAEATQRQNVVIFLADDQGWGDLSVHGNTNLATPNIDSLAREGAIFERFFVCPVCSPTRAEFLTGRYHARGGVRGVSTGQERLDLDERTIAQVFKAAGYATGAFGKWHNGLQSPYHPNDRGFDEYYGFCSGHWGEYFDPELDHNGRFVRGRGYTTDDFTERAMAFIEQNRNRPFFCYLPYNTPHSPMQVPDEYWERFANKELALRDREPAREDVPKTRAALAMCENIDWNVGRVLQKLDELKLAESTIVLYFCDNGPNGARWNEGMKGQKGSLDEGGVRSPLLIRWPGRIQPGTHIPQIAGAIDLLPTLAGLAGVPLNNEKPLDGVSLKPLLLGSTSAWPERMLFNFWNGRVSVRTQTHRLDPAGHLYDITLDPGQHRDIAAQNRELAERMSKAGKEMQQKFLEELGKDDRPFTVGYSTTTPLPARDGVPHGGVERSERAPNCSYFTNWTSTEDRMTWDIHVAAPGRFEAVIYYTCPAGDVGSTVELSFGAAKTTGKVNERHDPPLRGAENDRVPRRGESYVKDFRPLHLGAIELEGRGQLTLRAVDIPGKQVMDVRYLMLTRVE
jgi:arylsulfatase A-like enzyme